MSVESIKYHDICDGCAHKGYCDMAQFGGHNPRITACSHFAQAKQTNADRIRSMTDEELAEWIAYSTSCETCPVKHTTDYECHNSECKTAWGMWLKAEVDDGT